MSRANSSTADNPQPDHPHTAAQANIEEWQRAIIALDWDAVRDLLAEDVVYHNPATVEPYLGKDTLVSVLRTVFGIFKDFKYLRQFSSDTGYVLEFSARVGDENLFGVDIVEFNKEGLITKLMVIIRPANVVLTLSAEAAERLSAAPSAAE